MTAQGFHHSHQLRDLYRAGELFPAYAQVRNRLCAFLGHDEAQECLAQRNECVWCGWVDELDPDDPDYTGNGGLCTNCANSDPGSPNRSIRDWLSRFVSLAAPLPPKLTTGGAVDFSAGAELWLLAVGAEALLVEEVARAPLTRLIGTCCDLRARGHRDGCLGKAVDALRLWLQEPSALKWNNWLAVSSAGFSETAVSVMESEESASLCAVYRRHDLTTVYEHANRAVLDCLL